MSDPLLTLTSSSIPPPPPSSKGLLTLESPTLLTSYNHLTSTSTSPASILVPGLPALWQPSNPPNLLKPDSGLHYIDQSAARSPLYPFLPAFTALLHTNPSFVLADTADIVSCRNTLRKLLAFCADEERSFKFVAREAHGAVWLCRKEEALTENFAGFRGYGAAFVEDSTVWEPEARGGRPGTAVTSHHRVVGYRFGGLRCVVRFECDGYMRDRVGDRGKVSGGDTCRHPPPADVTALLGAMGNLSATRTASEPPVPSEAPTKFTVHPTGRLIPQSAILDVKTRVHHKPLEVYPLISRAWLSQTPVLVRGFWRSAGRGLGRFDDVRVETMDLAGWESQNQEVLKKLRGVLGEIVRLATDGEGPVEVSREGGGKLVVRRVEKEEKEDVLPEALTEKLKRNSELKSMVVDEGVVVDEDRKKGGHKHIGNEDSGSEDEEDEDEDEEEDEDSESDDEERDYTECDQACGFCGKCASKHW